MVGFKQAMYPFGLEVLLAIKGRSFMTDQDKQGKIAPQQPILRKPYVGPTVVKRDQLGRITAMPSPVPTSHIA